MPSLISQRVFRFGLSGCLWVFLLLANTVLFMSVWMRGGGGRGGGVVWPALAALSTTVNHQTGFGKIKWDSQSVWVVTGTARVGRDFYQGRPEPVSLSASQPVSGVVWTETRIRLESWELWQHSFKHKTGLGWALTGLEASENKLIYYFSPRTD